MKKGKELYDAIKKMATPADGFFPAIVKEVHSDGTCTVMADDTEYFDIRLQSITGNNLPGMIQTPAVNSVVMLQRIGSSNEFAIVLYSELQKQVVKIGTNSYTHDDSGFELKGGVDSLGKVLDDLVTAIQAITVNVTAVGSPTGIPINNAVFTTIKERLDLFIK